MADGGRTWRTWHVVMVALVALGIGGALATSSKDDDKPAPTTDGTSRVLTERTSQTQVATTVAPATTATSTTTTIPPAQRVMPAVRGQRLDLAMAHLRDAGYLTADVEIIGGGTFGVIDQSGWTVCSTEPAAGVPAPRARVIVARTC